MAKHQDPTALAQDIDRDLRVIREMIRRPLEAEFARGRLTGPQQSAMHALVQSDGMSLKELSGRLGLSHSTVSGIVDRLENRGLVERRTDEKDKRLTRILVSQKVRDYIRDVMPKLSIHPLVEAIGRASQAERRAIVKGLKTLRKILESP
ncbi:MAG TPA: MarR family transcriptional regulator [Blastocatellia bacterium]|jgi:DNA-binding MarR family transcriptional regulator|nr:MarR family transcriptional regulator [Blastocatellia bacterium]